MTTADPRVATLIRQVRALCDALDDSTPGPVFGEVLAAYERDRMPKLADTTRYAYRGIGQQLRRTKVVELRLGEITTADVLRASEISTGVSGQRAAAKHVGRVYQWAALIGLWDGPNPADKIKAYKAPVPNDALDADEVRRLIAALHDPDVGELWRRRTVFFLALQPWRSSEALGLRVEQVRGSWAHLPKTKSGARTLALSTAARELIERAADGRTTGLVFRPEDLSLRNAQEQVRTTLRAAAKLADLTVARLHALRHTGATNLQALGVPIADVGALLGHASTSSTLRYLNRNTKRQRAAIEQLGASLTDA